jgi:hypothetical protein
MLFLAPKILLSLIKFIVRYSMTKSLLDHHRVI